MNETSSQKSAAPDSENPVVNMSPEKEARQYVIYEDNERAETINFSPALQGSFERKNGEQVVGQYGVVEKPGSMPYLSVAFVTEDETRLYVQYCGHHMEDWIPHEIRKE